MTWQLELADQLRARLPTAARLDLAGSVTQPSELDDWSDLDVHLDLGGQSEPCALLADLAVWSLAEDRSGERQVLRSVFATADDWIWWSSAAWCRCRPSPSTTTYGSSPPWPRRSSVEAID